MSKSSLWLDPQALKRERLKSAFTQTELAVRAGIHTVTLSRIETGKQEASIATVRHLAEALNVHPTKIAKLKEED